jgi:hypothetical protein
MGHTLSLSRSLLKSFRLLWLPFGPTFVMCLATPLCRAFKKKKLNGFDLLILKIKKHLAAMTS